jgi:hypothetical protein
LSEADKILAAKIIRLRNHAFLLWQVFDTPADRRIFTPFHVEHVLAAPIAGKHYVLCFITTGRFREMMTCESSLP